MSESLAGKVAMVTGAARGIGRACALRFAADGADLILNDCCPEMTSLASAVENMGRRVLVHYADVANAASVEAMLAESEEKFGRLDILVNNAAWSIRKPFLDLRLTDARRTFDVTFWGSFHCTQQAARIMGRHGGGSIVMISSVHAVRPYPNAAAYNGAKAALNHFAASIALELAPQRIRVNTVEPGWIDTPGERLHNTEMQLEEGKQKLPMGRLGAADEVADAVAYLCSESASYVTGSTLRVDGGFSLRF
jgi:glucose 1-dehydrogenase